MISLRLPELHDLVPTSRKENEILREIESMGFRVCWIPECFENHKGVEESDSIAVTMAITVSFQAGERYVVLSRSSIKEARRLSKKYKGRKITITEILIHELTHVLMFHEKYERNPYGIPDFLNRSHGMRFSEIYSDLVDKYKVRYPNKKYYVGGS